MEEVSKTSKEIPQNNQQPKKKENQEPKQLSSQFIQPWSDEEIQSFLEEWELLEHEMYLPEEKNYILSKAIAERLSHRGIRKNRKKCLHLLVSLQDLYWTICEANKEPRCDPLPCPYGEAMHRILGWEDNATSSPFLEEATVPSLVYHSQYGVLPIPCEEPLWPDLPVIFMEDPLVPGWEPWNMNTPVVIPHPLPAFLPVVPASHQPEVNPFWHYLYPHQGQLETLLPMLPVNNIIM